MRHAFWNGSGITTRPSPTAPPGRGGRPAPADDAIRRERGRGRHPAGRPQVVTGAGWPLTLVTLAAAAVILLWAAYLARRSLLLVYLSALIAAGISPLAAWIECQHFPGTAAHPPRWLAALAVYVVVLGIVAGIAVAVLPPLLEQAQELAHNWPALLDRARGALIEHGLVSRRTSAQDIVEQIPFDAVRAALLRQFWNVIGGAVGVLLILVLSLYLLHDARRLRDVVLSLAPPRRRHQIRVAADQIGQRIGAWMTGQIMLCGIIGATTALGLGLLGIPYFYVLALVSAIGELIPYAGPIAAAIPGILLGLTVSWQMAVVVALFYLLQQQLENHLLIPKLMQHQVGLTPSVVIIAVTIGSMTLGVLGAIIAVPTAAILHVVVAAFSSPDDDGG